MDPLLCGQSLLEPLHDEHEGKPRFAAFAVRCRVVNDEVVAAMRRDLTLLDGPALCTEQCPLEQPAAAVPASGAPAAAPHPVHRDRTEVVAAAERDTVLGIIGEVAESLRDEQPVLGVQFIQARPGIITSVAVDAGNVLGSIDLVALPGERTLLRFYTCDERGTPCVADAEHRRLQQLRDALLQKLQALGLVPPPRRPIGFLATRGLAVGGSS